VSERHLVVSLAGHLLAVPIDQLRELSEPLPTAFLPLVPPWFRGLANLRGEVLAVLDALPFLGLGALAEKPSNRLLVLGPPEGEATAGLLVERVHGVVAVPPEAVRRTVELEAPTLPLAPYLEGCFAAESGEVAVLSVGRLLAALSVGSMVG
jgi:chemotaxis signal transduction protein